MSSSTATSPSTNTRNSSLPWPSLNARQRTPSRASTSGTTVSTSSVTADASASHSLSLEQKAASRQTLSRHLSQSQLGVANASTSSPVSPARRRSSVASTTGTAVSTSTDAASKVASKNHANATLATPSQSIVNAIQGESPVGTPASQHNQRRRSSQNSNIQISRSPSWMATTGKKSTLSVPQLASIEGSVADLDEGTASALQNTSAEDRKEVPMLGTDAVSSIDEVETSRDIGETVQETMKRQRSQQEIDEPEGRLKKRSSTPLRANSVAIQSDDLSLPVGAVSLSQEIETEVAAPKLDEKSGSGQGWMSYLTRPRSSKASHPKPDMKPVETDQTIKGVPQDQLLSAVDKEVPREPTSQSSSVSQLDLRAFAMGQTPVEAIAGAKPSSPVGIQVSEEEISSGQTPLVSGDEAVTPTQAAPVPRQHPSTAPRPASWWPFYTATETQSVDVLDKPEPVAVVPKQADAESEAQSGAPRVETGERTAGPENIVVAEAPSDASAISERSPIVQSIAGQGEGAGWGSWLGSYLTRTPVATTSITYGAGIAPSNASTTSAASSVAPEADETLPEVLEEGTPIADQSIQSIHINPLLSTMPASSWSNFFTSSRIYSPRKKIDNKPVSTEPENMEVDFSEMEIGAPGSPAQSYSTLKAGKIANERLKASNHSGSVKSLPIMKSASGSDSLSSRRPSTTSMQSSSSAQGLSTSSTPQGVVKPLTTDKKSSKGMSKSKSTDSQPKPPPKPNLILPSFEDTFLVPPRSLPPAGFPTRPPPPQSRRSVSSPSAVKKAVAASFTYFFSSTPAQPISPVKEEAPAVIVSGGKERPVLTDRVERLPKALKLIGEETNVRNTGKVVCIGLHGWFIQSYLKNVVGEPTGTSIKFASMMKSAVKAFYAEQGSPLNDEAITTIPLEGDGTVQSRLNRLYKQLTAREDWIAALNTADRVFVASHSQGTIVSAMLVSKLIHEGEINGTKVAMLNMCSVSQGPFFSLYNSWTVPAYLYFESKAATELFEFQKPESAPSAHYLECMQHILNAGVKVLFVASLNDQVVPLYSALFSSLSHPNILRAIFIDAQAFETSADFMTNLVVFSTRLRNAGLTPHGLDFHLSEALAGSLMGVGHSTVYDEPQVYKLAVRYLLETSGTLPVPTKAGEESTPLIEVEPFNPRVPANSYFLPWALRGSKPKSNVKYDNPLIALAVIEDQQIRTFFASELQQLRDEFERWDPKTKALQQVKTALEPLRFLPRSTLLVANSDVPEAAETGKGSLKKPAAKL